MTSLLNEEPTSRTSPALDLGPEIMRARVLTGYESARQMVRGFAWILYFIVGPFISFPYLSLMIAAASLGFEPNHSLVKQLLFFSVFTIVYALLFWYRSFIPRRDCFVLHECGIAIRMKLRSARISSNSMARFYSGRAPSAFESISLSINRIFIRPSLIWQTRLEGQALQSF